MGATVTRRDGDVAGLQYLSDPLLNKGTAFTTAEREHLGLEGLLPSRVESLAEQAARALESVRGKPSLLRWMRASGTVTILRSTRS